MLPPNISFVLHTFREIASKPKALSGAGVSCSTRGKERHNLLEMHPGSTPSFGHWVLGQLPAHRDSPQLGICAFAPLSRCRVQIHSFWHLPAPCQCCCPGTALSLGHGASANTPLPKSLPATPLTFSLQGTVSRSMPSESSSPRCNEHS